MATLKKCSQCGTEFEATQSGCPACQIKMGLGAQSTQATEMDVPQISLDELSEKFDDLEILEMIGVGGMGAVYRVRQKKLDRVVALKIIRPDISESDEFLQRFEREAKAMARLNHPNIVSIYDFGNQNGICYYLMELVDGPDLAELCRSEDLPPGESLEIVTQVCRAMQYAHDHGVVHRDIKPTNILLNREGVVKIADFGLAKLCSAGDPTTQLTQTRQVFGTPRYMAPEQIEATREVDHRADIYSLGVVFYELLTGELPLGRFDPPSERIQVDVRLDEVVLRALQKHPERRYQAAHEFQTDISRIVQPVPPVKSAVAKKQKPDESPIEPTERPPWQVSAMMVPGVLLAAVGLFFIAVNVFMGFFGQESQFFSRDNKLVTFGSVIMLVQGVVLVAGGLHYWVRSGTFPTRDLHPSPVRRLLNYRNLIYFLVFGSLLALALPWYEFPLIQPAESRDADTLYIFAHQMWIGFGAAILTFAFLPLLVFIDIYERQRMYFCIAQLILGVMLLNVAIAVWELHPSYLIPREHIVTELLSSTQGGAAESVGIMLLYGLGTLLVVLTVLRIALLGIQHFWSEPFREATGEVITRSGTRLVRMSRSLLKWIRSIS